MNPIHRYNLCGENRCNWAVVLLTSDGIFSAVSDYGEFGYVWRAHGCKDFREFFLNKPGHWHYFAEKFAGGRREYDESTTEKRLREFILQKRRRGDMSKEDAGELWIDLRYANLECKEDFSVFVSDHGKWWSEITECYTMRIPIMVERFTKEILPKLAEAIRAEMEGEKS